MMSDFWTPFGGHVFERRRTDYTKTYQEHIRLKQRKNNPFIHSYITHSYRFIQSLIIYMYGVCLPRKMGVVSPLRDQASVTREQAQGHGT